MEYKETLLYVNELKGLTFSIDKYQRGYRWGMREIFSLLEDILSFDGIKESFYCLQPLVVKEKDDNTFELIDGQQRSTTIYLILKHLLNENFYHIKYETRGDEDGYNTFLENINSYNLPDFSKLEKEKLDKNISDYWKNDFIKNLEIIDSVDNFYFFKAFCLITYWFSKQNEESKIAFKQNLLYNTKVIWYNEIIDTTNAANSFINFNDGKISLDQAELIKGLYVLNFNNIPDATRKSYEENQFAEEWNAIEHHLKVPSFWNFINNEKDNRELANKITVLLQIEKGKGNKIEDLFYTYRVYDNAFKSDTKPEWRNLSGLYNQLEEWYHNRETYLLMGAVVHLTNTSVHDVIKNYRLSSNKDALNSYLKDILKQEFFNNDKFKENFNPEELKYGKSGVFSILLLYNIAVAQLTDKYYKFPFDLFKQVKSWNIEHIYAKNSKGFESLEDLENWHKELSIIIEDSENVLKTNQELQKLWLQIELQDLNKSNSLVKKIESKLQELLDKDSLSNLCLLDNVTNIQVGNKVFRKKREMILELDKKLDKEAYVPIASKIVFQKSLTPSENLVMNYWNTMDREAYIEDVKNKIKEFLAVKI